MSALIQELIKLNLTFVVIRLRTDPGFSKIIRSDTETNSRTLRSREGQILDI